MPAMKISILIPTKNESRKLIANMEEKILPYFDECGITYDVLICADGGREEEFEAISAHHFPAHVKLLPLIDVKGKGHAVKRLYEESDSDYGLFMDADLSTDLSVFDLMKGDLGKVDCLIASRDAKGSRYGKKQPLTRRLTHFGCRKAVQWKFHMKGIKDTQCGYKCVRTDICKKICSKSIIDGFAFDVELLYILSLNGYSIREYPCLWTDDPDSSVSSPLKSSLSFYKDLRKIKKNRKNYSGVK